MIDQKIVAQKVREFEIQEYVQNHLQGVGLSKTKLQLTPMGEKIIIYTSRPGLIVGRKGQSIKRLTQDLKREFSLEHPQIEINEVDNPNTDPHIIAERIVNSLERFGINRFKGIGHKAMEEVMNAGALGIEILISGKVPSTRAKTWRFYQGYMKKCGEFSLSVRRAYAVAKLKSGIVGVQVAIMPGDIKLSDDIEIRPLPATVEEIKTKEASQKDLTKEIPKETTEAKEIEIKEEQKPKKQRKRKTKEKSIKETKEEKAIQDEIQGNTKIE